MSFRKRIFKIVEPAGDGDRLSTLFDTCILSLIGINIIAFVLETIEPIHDDVPRLFWTIEAVSVIVFSIEYVLRLWSCTTSPRYSRPCLGRLRFALTPMLVIDLLAVLPFYLPMLGVDLRVLRVLRVARVMRIAKLGRYLKAMGLFRNVLNRQREEIVISVSLLLVLLLIASSLMYFAEHAAQPVAFSSIPAAMWWAVSTLTTVGYGDVYPVTAAGKLLASVIAVLGIAMFALPTAILGAGFVEEVSQSKQAPAVCPHCGKALP